MESQNILNISNLCFAYQSTAQTNQVIQNLSLNVKTGEIVSILGASGCGKSTLLNLIAGLLTPQAGVIKFEDNSTVSLFKKQHIGYIFQDDTLLPWRTIESNLMLAADIVKDISKKAIKELTTSYLNTFHLDSSVLTKYPSQLSGGMRQRVSIMQTLMFNPQILLLDEPFSALDFFTKLRLEGEVYQLIKEQNKAAILITHDIDEAISIADRVLIMSGGGKIISEFKIDFRQASRSPEEVRGTSLFAEYYHCVWSQLRKVIEA